MPERQFGVMRLGGTFDAFHAGHADYLEMGLSLGRHLDVFVTPDELARSTKLYEPRSHDERRHKVERFLKGRASQGQSVHVHGESEAPFDALASGLDCNGALVERTYVADFLELNCKRESSGFPLVVIVPRQRLKIHGSSLSSSLLRVQAG